jgi:hypothetical protein
VKTSTRTTLVDILVSLVGGCFILLGLVGVFAIVGGIVQQHDADNAYVVEFSHPGADCGPGTVAFDVTNGERLFCGGAGAIPIGNSGRFPGFTDAQNQDVTALAEKLGSGGLSTDEQRQIQQRADQIAATVPSEARRPHDSYDIDLLGDFSLSLGPFWGSRLTWLGVAALASSVLVPVFFIRARHRVARRRSSKAARRAVGKRPPS